MLFRCILPPWAAEKYPERRRVQEGEFTDAQIEEMNGLYYNCYYLPNYPRGFEAGTTVDGSHIDTFNYCFVDFDLKSGAYPSKDAFIEALADTGFAPSRIVDTGGGIHAYWRVSDLDAMSYLRLTRRLMRRLNTDPAVGQIYQLMRAPGTVNTKDPENPRLCELLHDDPDTVYTADELDALLPALTLADEEHCQQHFHKTYKLNNENIKINDRLPEKFMRLLRKNKEVKELWSGNVDDRSKADYRLGHVMFASEFTREEATSVLVNSAKAIARAPAHRLSYAASIVDKIWTFEIADDKTRLDLSSSVKDILARSGDTLKGTRFPCWSYLDNTEHGFRLGQVIGLVAGSGVGKTSIALNAFLGFVQSNPDYDHFFVPLEQPANEIADRWQVLCGDNTRLHEKVHVISNYDDAGNFRHLSFDEIREYLLKFQRVTGRKVGCVVIDHIGALKKKGTNGENQDLMDICHQMKAFAVQTNTVLIMQSQAPREKAGIGDLELNKDSAYGTVFFESYCDYLITLWQPLKRCYMDQGCPTVTAFKFCKIRHKKQSKDVIKEDVCYRLFFDSDTQRLREMTDEEDKSFTFFLHKATSARKLDRKTDIIPYQSVRFTVTEGASNERAS